MFFPVNTQTCRLLLKRLPSTRATVQWNRILYPRHLPDFQIADLKNATDDALAPYLTTLPRPYAFKQEHYTTNIKLVLGYTAVLIAGVLFYADWKLGWDATKAYTGPACVAYFLLNGALTYWIWAVEAGTVFAGVREGGQKVILLNFSSCNE